MFSDAVDFDYASGEISGCSFEEAGNDGIDLMTSHPLVVSNRFVGMGDKGISIGEGASPLVVGNTIRDAHIGIEVKDGSRPRIIACRIHARDRGINAYAKNWRYADGGHAKVYETVIESERCGVVCGTRSDIQLFGCHVRVPCETNSTRGPVFMRATSTAPDLVVRAMTRAESRSPDREHHDAASPDSAGGMALVFHDTFTEDFTTDLSGWHRLPGTRDATKSRDHLRIRTYPGQRGGIERTMPAVARNADRAWLAIEAWSLGADASMTAVCGTRHLTFSLPAGRPAETILELPPGTAETLMLVVPKDVRPAIRSATLIAQRATE
jgi:hypothetical protein